MRQEKDLPGAEPAQRADEPPAPPRPIWQQRASIVLALAVAVLSLWVLRSFLPAIVWAAIIAVATWRPYRHLADRLPRRGRSWLALVAVLLVAVVFILPLAMIVMELGREVVGLIVAAKDMQKEGIAVPAWIGGLPLIGGYAGEWWRENLAQPGAAADFLGRIRHQVLLEWSSTVGIQILHRVATLLFTLLTLFFFYRDGSAIAAKTTATIERAFGAAGPRVGRDIVATVQGTVNGLVLVGLGEGVLLGIAFAIAGLSHAVALGALTAVLAVIPFGIVVVIIGGALVLAAEAKILAAVVLTAFGFAMVFVADHFVRPVLIGGATKLPFLLVLLGILGGLESFGLIGLFLGPVIMAALFALWRVTIAEPA